MQAEVCCSSTDTALMRSGLSLDTFYLALTHTGFTLLLSRLTLLEANQNAKPHYKVFPKPYCGQDISWVYQLVYNNIPGIYGPDNMATLINQQLS